MFSRGARATFLALLLVQVPETASAQDGPRYNTPASADRAFAAMPLWSASSDRVYRSCRRQVRRAAGIIPGMRMRLPRAYIHLVDRCVASGGVYS